MQTAQIPPHVPSELVVDFDLYDPPGAQDDFHSSWKALQDSAPDMVWSTANGGHWIALRGQLIHEIFADYKHFSSKVIIVPRERGDQIKVLPTTLDPPRHRPYRALLSAGLSPRVVRDVEPEIRELVAGTIDQFADKGRCEFIADFAEVLPITVFMHRREVINLAEIVDQTLPIRRKLDRQCLYARHLLDRVNLPSIPNGPQVGSQIDTIRIHVDEDEAFEDLASNFLEPNASARRSLREIRLVLRRFEGSVDSPSPAVVGAGEARLTTLHLLHEPVAAMLADIIKGANSSVGLADDEKAFAP